MLHRQKNPLNYAKEQNAEGLLASVVYVLDADAGRLASRRVCPCAWENLGEASGPLSRRSCGPQTGTLLVRGVGVSLMVCSTFCVDGSAVFDW